MAWKEDGGVLRVKSEYFLFYILKGGLKNLLIEVIGKPAMLEQTAEECSELAQACLKLARYMRGENKVYKTEEELLDDLHEEIADVKVCLSELYDHIVDIDRVNFNLYLKSERMKDRLKELKRW